jgi:hypothetical protein
VRRTVYLSLVTLGAASIATAAVMTTTPSDEPTPGRRAEARVTATTERTSAVASETETKSETKRECRKRCRFFGD